MERATATSSTSRRGTTWSSSDARAHACVHALSRVQGILSPARSREINQRKRIRSEESWATRYYSVPASGHLDELVGMREEPNKERKKEKKKKNRAAATVLFNSRAAAATVLLQLYAASTRLGTPHRERVHRDQPDQTRHIARKYIHTKGLPEGDPLSSLSFSLICSLFLPASLASGMSKGLRNEERASVHRVCKV